jgi:predicted GIY-YIG superfamily endonuclease
MPIVIVEGLNTYTLPISYEELISALAFHDKERARHREKARKQWLRNKEKKLESPPASEPVE